VDPPTLVKPLGRVHSSTVSPPPGASASNRHAGTPTAYVGGPSWPHAPPENLLPCGNRSATVKQALPILPLLLDVSLLVLLPQAPKQSAEKDDSEERDESKQSV